MNKTYKISRKITVPLAKLVTDEPLAVIFTGDVVRHVQIDSKPDKDGKVKAPATVLRCIEIETDRLIDLIAPAVLLSQLDREYGGHQSEIADKALLIESKGKRPGKGYHDIIISELEV